MSISSMSKLASWCIFFAIMSDSSSSSSLLENSPHLPTHNDADIEYSLVVGVYGMMATIPCFTNVSQDLEKFKGTSSKDRANLVLWFRDQQLSPFYTYDNVDLTSAATHWRDPSMLAPARYNFLMSASGQSNLQIKNIRKEDEGYYKCRVDFEQHQTVIWWSQLKVIVPPDKPRTAIVSGKNAKIVFDELEIFGEHQNITLLCQVTGGDPSPSLTWWRNGVLLDTSYERYDDKTVVNELTLSQVNREEQNSKIVCAASNNNITQPSTTELIINMRVLPQTVRISGPANSEMVAGKGDTFECVVSKANPRPSVFWLLNGKKYNTVEYVESEGDTVMSAIFLTPERNLHGAELSCRAEVANLTGHVEDRTRLNVKYGPLVSIRLGEPLDLENIVEGHDVYFSCQVESNPKHSSITWKFNGKVLDVSSQSNRRFLASDNILAIQGVGIQHSGNYSCSASNILGHSSSSHIHLDIKFRPKCAIGLKTEYLAYKHQMVKIECQVMANPSNNIIFEWTFNDTAPDYVQKDIGNLSQISWHPDLRNPSTSINCVARNSVGVQTTPCTFLLLSQYPPHPPDNCRISNITHSQFQVDCPSGPDSDWYHLSVRLSSTGQEVVLDRKHVASFHVTDLVPSTSYTIKLWKSNSLGISEANFLSTSTLNVPDPAERKYKKDSADTSISTSLFWFMIFLGVTLLVIILLLSVLALSLKRRRANISGRISQAERESFNSSVYHQTLDTGSKERCEDAAGANAVPLLNSDHFKKDPDPTSLTTKSLSGENICGNENILVYNACSDVTVETLKYATLASTRNKPIRESFI